MLFEEATIEKDNLGLYYSLKGTIVWFVNPEGIQITF